MGETSPGHRRVSSLGSVSPTMRAIAAYSRGTNQAGKCFGLDIGTLLNAHISIHEVRHAADDKPTRLNFLTPSAKDPAFLQCVDGLLVPFQLDPGVCEIDRIAVAARYTTAAREYSYFYRVSPLDNKRKTARKAALGLCILSVAYASK